MTVYPYSHICERTGKELPASHMPIGSEYVVGLRNAPFLKKHPRI